jgi:predicted HD phosphohydrolase
MLQGGRFNAEQVKEAQKDPLLEQKLAVRRWDDLAKVPGAKVPGLDAYEEMAVKCLLSS